MQDNNRFCTAFGEFELSRCSRSNTPKEQNLQPWDAADALLLEHLAEHPPGADQRLLIVNDQYGALATALSHLRLDFCTDSHLSQQAAQHNLQTNQKSDAQVTWHTSLDEVSGTVDYVLLKLPKSLALLEDQLYRYRALCTSDTVVIAAGMVKYLGPGVFKLFEKILGTTHTSLAKKKARLIFCAPQPQSWTQSSPYPSSYVLENTAYTLENHANVFSRESLDVGTRFFIEQLPLLEHPVSIADLGCGNGVVGLLVGSKLPGDNSQHVALDFYDESFMALASAQRNMARNLPGSNSRFIADDGMSSAEPGSYDYIFCNPPFHQHNVVGDFVALQMFKDAKSALKQGGAFWLVGNRHLGYGEQIKRLFGNAVVIATNQKFVVIKAIKR